MWLKVLFISEGTPNSAPSCRCKNKNKRNYFPKRQSYSQRRTQCLLWCPFSMACHPWQKQQENLRKLDTLTGAMICSGSACRTEESCFLTGPARPLSTRTSRRVWNGLFSRFFVHVHASLRLHWNGQNVGQTWLCGSAFHAWTEAAAYEHTCTERDQSHQRISTNVVHLSNRTIPKAACCFRVPMQVNLQWGWAKRSVFPCLSWASITRCLGDEWAGELEVQTCTAGPSPRIVDGEGQMPCKEWFQGSGGLLWKTIQIFIRERQFNQLFDGFKLSLQGQKIQNKILLGRKLERLGRNTKQMSNRCQAVSQVSMGKGEAVPSLPT